MSKREAVGPGVTAPMKEPEKKEFKPKNFI
nr:MAG TPA: hypothetical protein [Caudoviricetes sp.]